MDREESDATDGWKLHLQEGDEVDAQDTDHRWFEARVVRRRKHSGNQVDVLRIHYMGWSHKWDEEFPLNSNDHLKCIARRNTKVPYWRNFGAGGQMLEVRGPSRDPYRRPIWVLGVVKEVWDESESLPSTTWTGEPIAPLSPADSNLGGDRLLVAVGRSKRYCWVAARGENICKTGTHHSPVRGNLIQILSSEDRRTSSATLALSAIVAAGGGSDALSRAEPVDQLYALLEEGTPIVISDRHLRALCDADRKKVDAWRAMLQADGVPDAQHRDESAAEEDLDGERIEVHAITRVGASDDLSDELEIHFMGWTPNWVDDHSRLSVSTQFHKSTE